MLVRHSWRLWKHVTLSGGVRQRRVRGSGRPHAESPTISRLLWSRRGTTSEQMYSEQQQCGRLQLICRWLLSADIYWSARSTSLCFLGAAERFLSLAMKRLVFSLTPSRHSHTHTDKRSARGCAGATTRTELTVRKKRSPTLDQVEFLHNFNVKKALPDCFWLIRWLSCQFPGRFIIFTCRCSKMEKFSIHLSVTSIIIGRSHWLWWVIRES